MENISVLSALKHQDDLEGVKKLKAALASEYYAYHMYRTAYYRIRGLRRNSILGELWEHAEEELDHANRLEERIAILGGDTFTDPTEWDVWNNTDIPSIVSGNFSDTIKVIKDSEQWAVDMYTDLVEHFRDDPVTQDLLIDILSKEQEHLYDVKYNFEGLQHE